MEKYLKMSDVFEGEVLAKHMDDECVQEILHGGDCGNCWSIEDRRYWIAVTREHAEYAAHAINSHDELVAMNKELLAALEEISNLPSYRQDECSEMAREAIEKAKGGAA